MAVGVDGVPVLAQLSDVGVHVEASVVARAVEEATGVAAAHAPRFAQGVVLEPEEEGAAVVLVHLLAVDEGAEVVVAALVDDGPDVAADGRAAVWLIISETTSAVSGRCGWPGSTVLDGELPSGKLSGGWLPAGRCIGVHSW